MLITVKENTKRITTGIERREAKADILAAYVFKLLEIEVSVPNPNCSFKSQTLTSKTFSYREKLEHVIPISNVEGRYNPDNYNLLLFYPFQKKIWNLLHMENSGENIFQQFCCCLSWQHFLMALV